MSKKSSVIKAKDDADLVQKQVVGLREVTRPSKPETLPDKLAEDKVFYRNWYYNGGQNAFPDSPKMWAVDRFYPYAKPGPLAIDEAEFTDSTDILMQKKKLLESQGIKYVLLRTGITEQEAMEQLA